MSYEPFRTPRDKQNLKQAYTKTFKLKNPLKVKEYNLKCRLKLRYKLTKEEFEKLLINSGFQCEVCGKPAKLVLDHDHKTNKHRGILCHKCNVALGMVED